MKKIIPISLLGLTFISFSTNFLLNKTNNEILKKEYFNKNYITEYLKNPDFNVSDIYFSATKKHLSKIDFSNFNDDSMFFYDKKNKDYEKAVFYSLLLYYYYNQDNQIILTDYNEKYPLNKFIDTPLNSNFNLIHQQAQGKQIAYYNKDIHSFDKNLKILMKYNPDNTLLHLILNKINKIKVNKIREYDKLSFYIKNDIPLNANTIKSLILDIENEKLDNIHKPIVPMSHFFDFDKLKNYKHIEIKH